jgi:undecaprenyl-phosphate 4-deoxy-4-formamido-L-arabinose transferase
MSVEVSVVIPVYNSARYLPSLVMRLMSVLQEETLQFEIILVDDGSRDESWNILRELWTQFPSHVMAIQLMRNYGQHNALMCGFRQARGQFIVTMDDDLQNPPEEIPKLLSTIRTSHADLVYGVYTHKQHACWRNLGSRLVGKFHKKVLKVPFEPTSFRIIKRRLMESILSYNKNFTYIDGLLTWNTQRIEATVVEHHPRVNGQSGYSIGRLMVLAFNLFTNFSLVPLQLVSVWGMFVALVGLVFGGYYLVQSLLSNIAVSGYASTIVAILVLGGTQLLALGIIGEYLGRVHLNVNRKPQYVERHILCSDTESISPSGQPLENLALVGREHSSSDTVY